MSDTAPSKLPAPPAIEAARYNAYMHFKAPKKDVWDITYLSKQLANIGAANSTISDQDVDDIKNCYKGHPSFRHYHGPDHAAFVGADDAPKELTDLISTDDFRN